MTSRLTRWPAAAATALLVSLGHAGATTATPADRLSGLIAGPSASELDERLAGIAASGMTLDAADPATRQALDAALAAAGVAATGRSEAVGALLDWSREHLNAARVVTVGGFELTRAQVIAIAGPRAGRDRTEVAARLRAATPAARALSPDAAHALVPELVRIAEAADPGAGLAAVVRAIAPPGGAR